MVHNWKAGWIFRGCIQSWKTWKSHGISFSFSRPIPGLFPACFRWFTQGLFSTHKCFTTGLFSCRALLLTPYLYINFYYNENHICLDIVSQWGKGSSILMVVEKWRLSFGFVSEQAGSLQTLLYHWPSTQGYTGTSPSKLLADSNSPTQLADKFRF